MIGAVKRYVSEIAHQSEFDSNFVFRILSIEIAVNKKSFEGLNRILVVIVVKSETIEKLGKRMHLHVVLFCALNCLYGAYLNQIIRRSIVH